MVGCLNAGSMWFNRTNIVLHSKGSIIHGLIYNVFFCKWQNRHLHILLEKKYCVRYVHNNLGLMGTLRRII